MPLLNSAGVRSAGKRCRGEGVVWVGEDIVRMGELVRAALIGWLRSGRGGAEFRLSAQREAAVGAEQEFRCKCRWNEGERQPGVRG